MQGCTRPNFKFKMHMITIITSTKYTFQILLSSRNECMAIGFTHVVNFSTLLSLFYLLIHMKTRMSEDINLAQA